MIKKIQTKPENYKIDFHYYNRARDAMYDLVNDLVKLGYSDIFIPGYIGWSAKEGSGIFDPLNSIANLRHHYYRMTRNLWIEREYLRENLTNHSLLLVVNYFGFRDKKIKELIQLAHERDCIVIEDNAHGFFTYFCHGSVGADATFFSLHKMFPFYHGGGLVIENRKLSVCNLNDIGESVERNPFLYNINDIARVRIENFRIYMTMMEFNDNWFEPLRDLSDIESNVPQTFPVIIKRGDRDKIYEIMNEEGYGVVSLYHTMIDELRDNNYDDAEWISKHIINLPVHQDVDKNEIYNLVKTLKNTCIMTEYKSCVSFNSIRNKT
ncbi:MAG: DegT/DnrJ/EryC1/StrS aminotransferase family protein [Dorea sp.]|jgi:dTDP-4-amino-4,6-dideoxygalactose transaminase|nr:DegT/DnrJ/EryC1/StrS aminotransferase family protein [Dorea sp.]